jgi:hypothetical protein
LRATLSTLKATSPLKAVRMHINIGLQITRTCWEGTRTESLVLHLHCLAGQFELEKRRRSDRSVANVAGGQGRLGDSDLGRSCNSLS